MVLVLLSELSSPVGLLGIAERPGATLAVAFGGLHALAPYEAALAALGELRHGRGGEGAAQVSAFLAGDPIEARVDLALVRGDFQRRVLLELSKVKAGQTVSYGELARRVGSPLAARAVGGAMRSNPVPFLVPCHRVLPATGRLGHYSGGGPEVKRWLLERESARFTG